MKGFKTATETGIVLNASDELKVDEKLAVGSADRDGDHCRRPGAVEPGKRQSKDWSRARRSTNWCSTAGTMSNC